MANQNWAPCAEHFSRPQEDDGCRSRCGAKYPEQDPLPLPCTIGQRDIGAGFGIVDRHALPLPRHLERRNQAAATRAFMEMQRDRFAFVGEDTIAFRDVSVAMSVASRRITLPRNADP